MHITPISTDVRIVSYGSPFDLAEDLAVEERVSKAGEPEQWARTWATNSLANDLASSQAYQRARDARDRRLWGAA